MPKPFRARPQAEVAFTGTSSTAPARQIEFVIEGSRHHIYRKCIVGVACQATNNSAMADVVDVDALFSDSGIDEETMPIQRNVDSSGQGWRENSSMSTS